MAAYESEAGFVEAVQAVSSFADAARRSGAEIREGVEVKAVLVDKGHFVAVETSEGRYASRTVILATGPWAGGLARGLKLDLPVQACRTQVALFRRPPDFGRAGPVYGDFVQGIYFKPTHGEIMHVGSLAGEEAQDPVDPDEYNESADGNWLRPVRSDSRTAIRQCIAAMAGEGMALFTASRRIGTRFWTACRGSTAPTVRSASVGTGSNFRRSSGN